MNYLAHDSRYSKIYVADKVVDVDVSILIEPMLESQETPKPGYGFYYILLRLSAHDLVAEAGAPYCELPLKTLVSDIESYTKDIRNEIAKYSLWQSASVNLKYQLEHEYARLCALAEKYKKFAITWEK